MDVSSIGPSLTDPFSGAIQSLPDQEPQTPPPVHNQEPAPLPEDTGSRVDVDA